MSSRRHSGGNLPRLVPFHGGQSPVFVLSSAAKNRFMVATQTRRINQPDYCKDAHTPAVS